MNVHIFINKICFILGMYYMNHGESEVF